MQESLKRFWKARIVEKILECRNHYKDSGMQESLKRFWNARIVERILECKNH